MENVLSFLVACIELTAAFEVVIAQTAVECRRRDAEDLGGLASMPAGLFEGGEDLLAFDFAQ